ncbi:hypothetical protein CBER1_07614 [Cercospora berteroae]|uniref:Extracellular membrane protein CFEM domain-containing protein n=1 Tax=Cercospora berteroae TaxID=357750 RepID=A0A2S6BTU8_9PEZI|nr:hypothetical protein CBER1_07614 [Cercospora berteroae]
MQFNAIIALAIATFSAAPALAEQVQCWYDLDCQNGFYCGEGNTCADAVQGNANRQPDLCVFDQDCIVQDAKVVNFCWDGSCTDPASAKAVAAGVPLTPPQQN